MSQSIARPSQAAEARKPASAPSVPPERPPRRTLGELLEQPTDAADRWLPGAPKVQVDDQAAAAAGIRRLEGRHLLLYTDLPASEATDRLPAVFDQAIGQWCDYFGVPPEKASDWRATGFLIHDRDLFRRLGLLPADLPPFQHGFCRNTDFWIYEKPSDYYNRHQVLHEGTHSFMNSFLGACGPPWFMEGTAELLATHRLVDGQLKLNQAPRRREDVPLWGRIKRINLAIAAGRWRTLRQVLGYRFDAYLDMEPYAWSWAAALFLDRHPDYGDRFRRLSKRVLQPDVTEQFIAAVGDDWPALEQQWRVFIAELEYGCDPTRMFVDATPGKPFGPAGARVEVAADRGWQNSGLRLERGKTYELRAEGRYQVADKPKIWWCEPGGVTIRYYRSRPLGMLLAMVLPDAAAGQPDPPGVPPPPVAVGLGTTLVPEQPGTLYFKINESSGELGDNRGGLSVEIRAK